MDRTKLNNLMEKFETHLIVNKGLSENTSSGYIRSVSMALRRMEKFIPHQEDVEELIVQMVKSKMSYSHIANTSLALEHYGEFKCVDIKIGRPKKPKRIIKDVPSEAEISLLLQACKNSREKAILATLALSGLRNAELCNIKVEDVNLGANQITVVSGKNKTDGIVNISSECANVLIQYLKDCPRERGQYLFTTLAKKNKLATGDVRKLLRVVAKRAKLTRRLYPHKLRHSLAMHLLNRGASLLAIQAQLRHRHLATTLIYVYSTLRKNRSDYERCLPAYL